MTSTIGEIRREYNLGGLRRSDLAPNPIAQFQQWFAQAASARTSGRVRKFAIGCYKALLSAAGREVGEANAMVLATADKQGRPSARVVLLKGVDERGFIFFTNYESRKGQELTDNPQAALVFYWANLERQVCVAGTVVRLSREESAAYFNTRPRGSRLGAWASRQSRVVRDRAALEEQWKQAEARYPGAEVPVPDYWGGYVLSPTRVEFWQGRPNRLHDRFCYSKQPDNSWQLERLSP
jgi:pyridoxamine 5'-phosphate oxidase